MSKQNLTISALIALLATLMPKIAIIVSLVLLFGVQLQQSMEEVEGETNE